MYYHVQEIGFKGKSSYVLQTLLMLN